jgi:hypothetical protein
MTTKKIDQEQIDQWKKKHGTIFLIKVEDKVCYLKKPDRKTLSYAATVGAKDNLKFNEAILANCWLGGDEEMKTDDSLFLSVSTRLAEIIEIKEAELVKL